MTTDRREYMHAYYLAHKERSAEASRAYRAEHGDELREYSQRYYRDNRQKWANAPADTVRKVAAAKRWKKRNPEAVKLSGHLRRVTIRTLRPVVITERDIAARRAYLGEQCWICHDIDIKLTWDHVKPIKAGGIHVLSNMRLACTSCNCTKGARWYGIAGLNRLVDEVLNKVQATAYMAGGIGR